MFLVVYQDEFEKMVITATTANSWIYPYLKNWAKSNAEIVARMVRISKEMGRETADPSEAKKILGI